MEDGEDVDRDEDDEDDEKEDGKGVEFKDGEITWSETDEDSHVKKCVLLVLHRLCTLYIMCCRDRTKGKIAGQVVSSR